MSEEQIKNSNHESINVEINPLVIQLQEFGYDNIYSRRVFYYLHPEDIDEALNYMSIENGIIQHQFVKDKRNISNEMCYICNENEEIHLKELNNSSISIIKIKSEELSQKEEEKSQKEEKKSEKEEEKKSEKEEEKKSENIDNNSNQIKNSVIYNIIDSNGNKLNLSFMSFGKSSSVNTDDNNNESSTKNENNKNQVKKSLNSSNEIKTIKKNLESEFNNLNINKEIKKQNKSEILENSEYKIELKLNEEKKECEICNEIFQVNEFNKLEKCGHSFCSSCWYDALSVKIKENKLSSIKCLNYNCPEKLSDSFIINILKDDNDLLKKYNRYKLELEIKNYVRIQIVIHI